MTRDEQKQITEFIERSVRAGAGMPLDFEADAIIRALFVRNPEAAYRITMLAISQTKALEASRELLVQINASRRKGWFFRLFSDQKNRRSNRNQHPGMTSRSVSG